MIVESEIIPSLPPLHHEISQRLILRVFVLSARIDHAPVVKPKALCLTPSAISRCGRYYAASVFHFK